MLKNIRQLHLYLGVFFAPLIIFFALTGAVQTFGLHEKGSGALAQSVAKLSQIHIHQRYGLPPQRPEGPPKTEKEKPQNEASTAKTPDERPAKKSTLPFEILVLLMALGLTTTSILGIIMAFKYNRDERLIWGLLTGGTMLPILMLLV